MMAQHLTRSANTAMAQATTPVYAESLIMRDNKREPPRTTEDDPTPTQTETKDQSAKPEIADAEMVDV